MITIRRCTVFLTLCAAPVWAVEPVLDYEVGYAARETLSTTDNDIFGAEIGFNWWQGSQGTRAELSVGSRVEGEFDSGSLVLGIEAVRFQDRGPGRLGWGGRIDYAEDATTTGEIGIATQRFYDRFSLRATAGLQGSLDDVEFGDDGDVFGVAEATWYPSDALALRIALQADGSGELAGFGFEWQIGRSDFSIVAQSAFGIGEYRSSDSYDDLTVAIRYTPGAGSPKRRDRTTGDQLLKRLVDVQ